MFRRRRAADQPAPGTEGPAPDAPDATADPPPAASPDDVLLAETVARHFGGAWVEGGTAWLGIGDLRADCEVATVQEHSGTVSASLFLRFHGAGLGSQPVFVSVSGYGATPEEAVVTGACLWSCTFGPVLATALTGAPVTDDGVDEFEAVLGGRRVRVVVAGMDRVMSSLQVAEPGELIAGAREALAARPWLTRRVLAPDGQPPLLTGDHTVVSAFVGAGPGQTLYEFKVNGADWPPLTLTGPPLPGAVPGTMVLLRELAVLSALEPAPPLAAGPVQRTLDGLAARRLPHQVAGWQGWAAHGGRLGRVLSGPELEAVERETGPLPREYRDLLTGCAGPGAGPGYGLLPPRRVGDVVPLAHAGCGVVWLLRLDGEQAGTVWVDAAGSDGTERQVAGSVTEWFTAWLDHAIRDLGPWLHWDPRYCATSAMLARYLDGTLPPDARDGPLDLGASFGPAAIRLTVGAGYLPEGSAGDPCHGCVATVARFNLGPEVFAPGVLSASSAG